MNMKIQSKDNLKMFYYVREGSEEIGEGGWVCYSV